MTKRLSLIFALIIAIIAFLKYGRSIYMPIVNKLKGPETVESRILSIEDDVLKRLHDDLIQAGFGSSLPKEILLAAFKEERILEVYGKANNEYKLIKEYPFTAFSGVPGPKLKKGDKQIPEGIYKVEYLNPNSSYYLSIKVNYPNEFDKLKSQFDDVVMMGGDIFIHGKSATIGCIPIGDAAIEEVFFLTKKAINKPIKVIISPRDFRKKSEFPTVDSIDWEKELYDIIKKELNTLPDNGYKASA